MPTDLSGTPTTLGIGTYNVDVDAPSGLGFNEAMAQIDALIGARVATPTGIAAGEVIVWNGSAWVRSSVLGMSPSGISGYPSPSDVKKVLRGDGSWGYPRKINFTTYNLSKSTTGTSFATGVALVADISFVADGTSSYLYTISCGEWYNNTAGDYAEVDCSLDSAFSSMMAQHKSTAANAQEALFGRAVVTPAAGTHTINAVLFAGTGGTAFVRGDASPIIATLEIL